MTALEHVRKSSDWEQTALRQAQESLEPGKTATSNAARSIQRENYMLDLMTDASQDMAGTFFHLRTSPLPFCLYPYTILVFFCLPQVLSWILQPNNKE
jgi:hypothetical protein